MGGTARARPARRAAAAARRGGSRGPADCGGERNRWVSSGRRRMAERDGGWRRRLSPASKEGFLAGATRGQFAGAEASTRGRELIPPVERARAAPREAGDGELVRGTERLRGGELSSSLRRRKNRERGGGSHRDGERRRETAGGTRRDHGDLGSGKGRRRRPESRVTRPRTHRLPRCSATDGDGENSGKATMAQWRWRVKRERLRGGARLYSGGEVSSRRERAAKAVRGRRVDGDGVDARDDGGGGSDGEESGHERGRSNMARSRWGHWRGRTSSASSASARKKTRTGEREAGLRREKGRDDGGKGGLSLPFWAAGRRGAARAVQAATAAATAAARATRGRGGIQRRWRKSIRGA